MNSESVNLIYLDPPFNSNDHDELCRDRLLALLCDRDYLTGEFRRLESGSREAAGGQEHPEPARADSGRGSGGTLPEDRGGSGRDGRAAD